MDQTLVAFLQVTQQRVEARGRRRFVSAGRGGGGGGAGAPGQQQHRDDGDQTHTPDNPCAYDRKDRPIRPGISGRLDTAGLELPQRGVGGVVGRGPGRAARRLLRRGQCGTRRGGQADAGRREELVPGAGEVLKTYAISVFDLVLSGERGEQRVLLGQQLAGPAERGERGGTVAQPVGEDGRCLHPGRVDQRGVRVGRRHPAELPAVGLPAQLGQPRGAVEQRVGLPGGVRRGEPAAHRVTGGGELLPGVVGVHPLGGRLARRVAGHRDPAFGLQGQDQRTGGPGEVGGGGPRRRHAPRVGDRGHGGRRPERDQQRQAGDHLRTGAHWLSSGSIRARSRLSSSGRPVTPSRWRIRATWCSTVFAER